VGSSSCVGLMRSQNASAPVARRAYRWGTAAEMAGARLPLGRARFVAARSGRQLGCRPRGHWTGLPSESILWTSPIFSSRMPASTLDMSPTTSQIRCWGWMYFLATSLASVGVTARTF
jgi:hypothetical protein